MRSSMSAQSLASVPPSRALIVRIAPASSFGPLSNARSSSSSSNSSSRPISEVTSSAIDSSSSAISNSAVRSLADSVSSSSGPTTALRDFSREIFCWAASLSSQNEGLPISASICLISSRLSAWSKRVSELLQTLSDRFAALNQFRIHDFGDSRRMMGTREDGQRARRPSAPAAARGDGGRRLEYLNTG